MLYVTFYFKNRRVEGYIFLFQKENVKLDMPAVNPPHINRVQGFPLPALGSSQLWLLPGPRAGSQLYSQIGLWSKALLPSP
jgi:hypothetical protein